MNYVFLILMFTAKLCMGQQVILTADDFGVNLYQDSAITDAARSGLITGVMARVNSDEAAMKLKKLQRLAPDVAIGIQLNITAGKPVLSASQVGSLLSSKGEFRRLSKVLPKLRRYDLAELEAELDAQIQLAIKSGVNVRGLCSNENILSLYAPFFEVLMKLALKYDLWVRCVDPLSLIDSGTFGESLALEQGKRTAKRYVMSHPFKAIQNFKFMSAKSRVLSRQKMRVKGVRSSDYLCINMYKRATIENFEYLIKNLPKGITEMVVHLSYAGKDGREMHRVRMMRLLQTGQVFEVLKKYGVGVARF